MQLVSVHSHKGGAGKTALVLMMARHLAEHGKKVCLVDLDFLGTGVWPTIKASLPHRYLGEVFVAAAGSRSYPPLEDLLGFHRIGAKVEPIGLILNAGSAAGIGKNGKRAELHEQVVRRKLSEKDRIRDLKRQINELQTKINVLDSISRPVPSKKDLSGITPPGA